MILSLGARNLGRPFFRRALVVALSLFAIGVISPRAGASAGDDLGQEWRKTAPCAAELQKLFESWNATSDWRRLPGDEPGTRLYRAPTVDLGKWVELKLGGKVTSVDLFNATTRLQIRLGKNCETQASLHSHPSLEKFPGKKDLSGIPILHDEDIARLFGEKKSGIIYLWTPHKEISVEGLKEIREVAAKMRMPLYAVVEPTSSPSTVKRVAGRMGLPEKELFFLDSFDLQYRGFRLHFPSMIVFNKGKFTSPVRRGFEDAFVYEEYVRGHL